MKKKISIIIVTTILGIFAFISLYPLFFVFITSFKNNAEFYNDFFGLPAKFRWWNYLPVLYSTLGWLKNSAIYSGVTLVVVLIVTSTMGYGFARYKFKFKELWFYVLLAPMMIPGLLILPSLYIEIVQFGWQNQIWSLLFPWTAGSIPISVLILRRFFATQPVELFEAAKVDGASELRIFISIAIPLAKPILTTVAILNILGTFNDLLWPMVAIGKQSLLPVSVGILNYGIGSTGGALGYGNIFASYVLATLPLLILFAFMARSFVNAITEGAIK